MMWILCFATLLASVSAAQAPTPAPAKELTGSVEEVVLDLVVHDKKGKPVSDLRPTDLRVEDGGSVIKLNDLRLKSAADGQRYITLVFDVMDPLISCGLRVALPRNCSNSFHPVSSHWRR